MMGKSIIMWEHRKGGLDIIIGREEETLGLMDGLGS